MENIVSSISLSKDMEQQIKALAKKRGQTKSSLIQEALRDFIQRREVEGIERKMQAKARDMGIESDEDVVSLIHEVRKRSAS